MFKNITILFIAVMISSLAYAQEATITGKVSEMDVESEVVTVLSGTITKQAFSDARLDADMIWGELVKNGYIDPDGTMRGKFYALNKYSDMLLPKNLNAKKRMIFDILEKTLDSNEGMLFYIATDSELLQRTHRITSVDIDQGDPVTVQYITSSGKNNVIRLVDSKLDDQ